MRLGSILPLSLKVLIYEGIEMDIASTVESFL